MGRLLCVVYGAFAYLLFLATWVYFIGFLSGIAVPKSVDSAPPAGALEAGGLAGKLVLCPDLP